MTFHCGASLTLSASVGDQGTRRGSVPGCLGPVGLGGWEGWGWEGYQGTWCQGNWVSLPCCSPPSQLWSLRADKAGAEGKEGVTAQREKGLGSLLSTLSSGLRTIQEFAVSSEISCNYPLVPPSKQLVKNFLYLFSALHLCHLPIMSPPFPKFLR